MLSEVMIWKAHLSNQMSLLMCWQVDMRPTRFDRADSFCDRSHPTTMPAYQKCPLPGSCKNFNSNISLGYHESIHLGLIDQIDTNTAANLGVTNFLSRPFLLSNL